MSSSTTVQIRTADGVVDATEHRPAGTGPWPAVVLFMDALGMRPALEATADRLSGLGFFVLVPDLLYRAGKIAPFDPKTVWTDDAERKRLWGVLATATPEGTMRDVGVYLEHLKKTPDARADHVGVVGYCLGGLMAFRAAAAWPERVAAVASIHGGNLVTDKPDSPHLAASKVKARCYFACADEDRSCTDEHRATLEAALKSAGVRAQVEFYPGKKHGWAMPDFPVYDKDGAEQHWQRVGALFKEALT